MATWPAPSVPVFAAGAAPTETTFNGWWYETAGFLQNKVVLRVSQSSAATTLPDTAAATRIAYDTVLEDPYNGWSASTHLWTPPSGYSAWYQVTFTVRTAAIAGLVDLQPLLSGTYAYLLACVQGNSAGGGVSATNVVYLVGGQDTVGGACELLNSGSNVNTSITAGQQSTLEVTWISQS